MRLLLVDDDRGLRTLLRTTFEVFDIEVDEADSASVALERIASRRPMWSSWTSICRECPASSSAGS